MESSNLLLAWAQSNLVTPLIGKVKVLQFQNSWKTCSECEAVTYSLPRK